MGKVFGFSYYRINGFGRELHQLVALIRENGSFALPVLGILEKEYLRMYQFSKRINNTR